MFERLIGASCEKCFVYRLECAKNGDRFQTMLVDKFLRWHVRACDATWQFPEWATLIRVENAMSSDQRFLLKHRTLDGISCRRCKPCDAQVNFECRDPC